jgi:hypothetical protein
MSVESEFRQVLAEMEVWLQFGSTMNLEPTRRGGDVSSGRPPGDDRAPHVVWRERWERASVLEYEKLLGKARGELAGLLKQKRIVVVAETQPELEARMIHEGRGWSPKDVAQHFKCTPTFVRRVRLTAGVNAATGEPLAVVAAGTIEEGEKARELARDGHSEKQIRMILNCGGSKVRRLLGRAA